MKKIICIVALGIAFLTSPCFAVPSGPHGGAGMRIPPMHGGISIGHRPPMHGGAMHRPPLAPPHHIGVRPLPPPPLYRPMPIYRPYYYSSVYYPSTTYYSTTYTTYPTTAYETTVTPVATNTVVVRDNYAGINTAANVINAAANVAATIRYLTW